MGDLVRRDDHDNWTLLTLNRPERLNALTVAMFRELRQHVADLKKDDSIHCVVLRGAGKCFSAGHDLADIATGEETPSRGWHSETLRMMEKLPQPVIAAVQDWQVPLHAVSQLAASSSRKTTCGRRTRRRTPNCWPVWHSTLLTATSI